MVASITKEASDKNKNAITCKNYLQVSVLYIRDTLQKHFKILRSQLLVYAVISIFSIGMILQHNSSFCSESMALKPVLVLAMIAEKVMCVLSLCSLLNDGGIKGRKADCTVYHDLRILCME